MRNHSTKYHLPTKEVTRIVRFNGKDYLLSSLYDDAVEFDFDKEYEKTKKTENRNVFRGLIKHSDNHEELMKVSLMTNQKISLMM